MLKIGTTATTNPAVAKEDAIESAFWMSVFPKFSTEIVFHTSPALCTFDIMLYILKNHKLSKNYLKEILAELYKNYYTEYRYEIIEIFKLQGKNNFANKLLQRAAIDAIVMGEDYYVTNLDLWLLAKHFNTPVIFYHSKKLKENNKKFMLVNTVAGSENYYFIKSPGITPNKPNNYRLVIPDKVDNANQALIPLSALQNQDIVTEIKQSISENKNNLTDYFETVSELDATKKLREKKMNKKL